IIATVSKHAALIAQLPRQEELDALLNALRQELVAANFIANRDDVMIDSPNAIDFLRRAIGSQPPSFAERVMQHIEQQQDKLWQERTKTLNWELFDYAKVEINDLLLDSIYRTALGTPLAGAEPDQASLASSRQSLTDAFANKLFLWTKSKDDIVKEMDSEVQMP